MTKKERKAFLKNLGLVIKLLRTERSLTQEQMANGIGISQSNLSKYERGALSPNVDFLMDIATFIRKPLCVSLGDQNGCASCPSKSKTQYKTILFDVETLLKT